MFIQYITVMFISTKKRQSPTVQKIVYLFIFQIRTFNFVFSIFFSCIFSVQFSQIPFFYSEDVVLRTNKCRILIEYSFIWVLTTEKTLKGFQVVSYYCVTSTPVRFYFKYRKCPLVVHGCLLHCFIRNQCFASVVICMTDHAG